MKTSDSYLKVNQNIYSDAVTYDKMRLIGPQCDKLGPINIVYLKVPNANTEFLSTQDWDFEICLHQDFGQCVGTIFALHVCYAKAKVKY